MKPFREQHEIFLQRNKSTLVISAGDSWTFGDSLGTIAKDWTKDDYQARSTQVYGRLVADELDADWLNYGICGGNNLTIITFLSNIVLGNHYKLLSQKNYNQVRERNWPLDIEEIFNNETEHESIIDELKTQHCKSNLIYTDIIKHYKKVIILITLTETGRDITAHAQNVDLSKYFTSMIDYLLFEEKFLYDQLKHVIENSQAEFYVGRNFSIDFTNTTNSLVQSNNIWIKINYENNQKNNLPNADVDLNDILLAGPLSGVSLNPLSDIALIDTKDRKQYFVEQIDRTNKLWHWLRNNPLHHNRATCHPNQQAHVLWADNFINQIVKF